MRAITDFDIGLLANDPHYKSMEDLFDRVDQRINAKLALFVQYNWANGLDIDMEVWPDPVEALLFPEERKSMLTQIAAAQAGSLDMRRCSIIHAAEDWSSGYWISGSGRIAVFLPGGLAMGSYPGELPFRWDSKFFLDTDELKASFSILAKLFGYRKEDSADVRYGDARFGPGAQVRENVALGFCVEIGPDAYIGVGTTLEAFANIGRGASLGQNVIVRQSAHVPDGAVVKGGSVIEVGIKWGEE